MMIRRFLINFIVKHYFHGLTKEDVLDMMDGRVRVEGHLWTDEETQALISNASFLKNSRIHKELQKLLIYQAEERMFRKGTTPEDLLFGRALLFYVHEYDAILEDLQKRNES